MDAMSFCRVSYLIILVSFFLIIWTSLSGANGVQTHPNCHFSSFCSCSKNGPDLGIVTCHNVHLPRIPETINISKVFMLHLENNNLRLIEPHFLQSTGLYKVVVSKNPLYLIPDEAFLGLERSLWELELSHTKLAVVPNRALRHLRKLRILDLTGNSIAKLAPDNWRGLEISLNTLILTDNSITHLPTDSFSGLPLVETIDLRGNNLKEIDPSVFRDGMGKLSNLILADNQLTSIPYQALSYLKALRFLDLRQNKIGKMQPATDVGVQNVKYNFQFNLDQLRLDYNQITTLETAAFRYFNTLNRTHLDGNPINLVQENAFRNAKIRELYLRHCNLQEISPLAFTSLENSLEILDLSGNHISGLSEEVFHRFELLKSLAFGDNVLGKIDVLQALASLQFSLFHLDLSGNENLVVNIQELRRLRSLRTLSLSRLSRNSLSPEDFLEFGIDLEELSITFGGLNKIKNNAFRHVHGLRKLQFSDNRIENIEDNAFIDIVESLRVLDFSRAFSSSILDVPHKALKQLTNLEKLDLSNNKIRNMPDTSFHFLHRLRWLNLDDNIIETIHKGTFQGDIHNELQSIYLSFNNLKTIQQHTFSDLDKLEQLHLDDNRIESIDRRAFMNLKSLKRLNLKGNEINTVSYEAFQNLPQLEELDFAFNKLNALDFSVFDQVGSLATFHLNVSHNKLEKLAVKSFDEAVASQNIKILDLSFNNISFISGSFFKPVELSLSHLFLGRNKLLNATKDIFGHMPHLQVLDLSHNVLYEIDFDTFRSAKKLEHFYVHHNRIAEIPHDLFRFSGSLKLVDFSHNRLRFLPDNLFREAGLERLDVSHNLLGKLPLNSLSVASAETLCELDLSWNGISSLSHGGQLARFRSLTFLDLSYNRLGQIDSGTFKGVPKLSSLNLGHNSQLTLEPNGLSLQGLEYSLIHLNLDNVSLSQVPTLSTPNLLSLSLAFNSLPTVSAEIAGNVSSLRELNLDYNDLSVVPIVTHSLTELRVLSMVGNPVSSLSNTSLLGVANQLEFLDLRNIDLNTLETGAFCKMQSLRTLKLDLYKNVQNFNVPRILFVADGLKNLEIFVAKDLAKMGEQMTGMWPNKLQNFTVSGKGFKSLTPVMFEGIQSSNFQLNVENSSLVTIPSEIFFSMKHVRNISLNFRNNPVLKSVQNPSTGQKLNKPRSTFLVEAKLSGSQWVCDCELGWIEVWQRKKRQYMCPSQNLDYNCRHTKDDLRTSFCHNKNNRTVIDVLKTEIECGWSKASINQMITPFLILVQLLILIV